MDVKALIPNHILLLKGTPPLCARLKHKKKVKTGSVHFRPLLEEMGNIIPAFSAREAEMEQG